LLKTDTEGNDYKVLSGLGSTDVGTIVTEFWGRDCERLWQWLCDHNYNDIVMINEWNKTQKKVVDLVEVLKEVHKTRMSVNLICRRRA